MNLPRLVLFDVGAVLIQLRPWDEALPPTLGASEAGELNMDEIIDAFRTSPIYKDYELGRIGTPDFCEAVREFFSCDLSDDEISRRYVQVLGDEVEGMQDLIRALKAQGVRVAGLSDTSPLHVELLAKYPVMQELEGLFASCETGRAKPHRETFLHAVTELKVNPADTLFTDDLEANVEGARLAGLQTHLFQCASKLRAFLGMTPQTGCTM